MTEGKRHLLALAMFILFVDFLNAQSLTTLWQKSFGGSLNEFTGRGRQSLQTFDGGSIIVGQTESGNSGGLDIWLVKSDPVGNIQWQKTFGAFNLEYASSVQQTTDSGFVIAGYTNSNNNADVGINHGAFDAWVIRTDKNGNLLWQKTMGGIADDYADVILQTADGGFIVAGNTLSDNTGDVGTNHGLADSWIIRLDSAGSVLWQKLIGGDQNDISYDITSLYQGGYIIAGCSKSDSNGDVGINRGAEDFWMVRLDDSGTILWEKTYGGNQSDVAYSIQQTPDSGFIVAGYTKSDNIDDVDSSHGETDAWIVNLDSAGYIKWQKTFGGNKEDVATSIIALNDGDFLFAGYSQSNNNGDVGLNNGDDDGWLVKINNVGTVLWTKTIGGYSKDIIAGISATKTGGIIVAGDTYSDTSAAAIKNHSSSNYWLIRMEVPSSFTDSVSAGSYCIGDTMNIPYTTSGYFNSNNNFIVQLSDTAGNFSSADTISFINSSTSGIISIAIPNTILPGSGYKIRLVSSDPGITGKASDVLININNCIVTLNLRLFIQGFYLGNGNMQSVLFNNNLTTDLADCDSITIELHDALSPGIISYSSRALLHIDGTSGFELPYSFYGSAYYIVIRHRNSIETWSKNPYTFSGNSVSCDFSGY